MKLFITLFAFVLLISQSAAYICSSDAECCPTATCIAPRGSNTTQCVLPNDALCPDACDPNPCKRHEICVNEPKQCIRAPCPQYRCEPNCVICPLFVPQCEGGCGRNQVCEVTPQTCTSCASARCVQQCVACPKIALVCNIACRRGFHCEVAPQTCKRCGFVRCVRDRRKDARAADDNDNDDDDNDDNKN